MLPAFSWELGAVCSVQERSAVQSVHTRDQPDYWIEADGVTLARALLVAASFISALPSSYHPLYHLPIPLASRAPPSAAGANMQHRVVPDWLHAVHLRVNS